MPPRKETPHGKITAAEYRFTIDAYTPDTIPMARLSEYMAQLAQLLGEQTAVHFKRLEKGSTVLVQKVDFEAIPKVRHRTTSLRRGDAPPDALRAFKGLNKLLRDDNASGALRQNKQKATVLYFPGQKEVAEQFSAIRQHGSIDGVLNRIGGRDETVYVTLEMEGQQVSGCYASRAIAKELRHLLFEQVRLFGRGRWNRDDDGNWTLDEFKIESFEPLKDTFLSDALRELRAIPTEWTDQAYEELSEIRHGPRKKLNGGH